jgi:hypothetical protein
MATSSKSGDMVEKREEVTRVDDDEVVVVEETGGSDTRVTHCG